MGISTGSLKKIFRPPQRAESALAVQEPPPGRPPHVDWIAVADSFIYDHANTPEDDRKQGIFHPSAGLVEDEGIGNCLRMIVFDLLCAPRSAQKKSPQLCRILENGKNRHTGLNTLFTQMAEKRHMGIVRFEHDLPARHHSLPLSGEADGRITLSSGHRYVVDFKTINLKNFGKTFEPGLRYRVQLNTYLGLLGEKVGYILYECKDNQKWASPMQNFRVDFDQALYTRVEQYCADILNNYIKSGKLPAFDKEICEENNTFCSYMQVCETQRNKPKLREWDWRPEETKRRHLEVMR